MVQDANSHESKYVRVRAIFLSSYIISWTILLAKRYAVTKFIRHLEVLARNFLVRKNATQTGLLILIGLAKIEVTSDHATQTTNRKEHYLFIWHISDFHCMRAEPLPLNSDFDKTNSCQLFDRYNASFFLSKLPFSENHIQWLANIKKFFKFFSAIDLAILEKRKCYASGQNFGCLSLRAR